MQTPDQVAGEAREKLASRSEVIGENIRLNVARRRSDLGLSLQQVADRSGLTKAHVWEVEKGRSRNVSVTTIAGLASALDISEIDLLGLAALRAQPERGAEEWNYDMDAAPTGQNNSVLVSVPAFAEGHAPFVGEAYYHHASDDTTDHYQGWWWAGTSPSDYWASPIREVNAEPIAWRHLPEPAAIRTLPLHPAKDEGGGR